MLTKKKLLLVSFMISSSIFLSVSNSKASEQVLATLSTDVTSDSYQLIVDCNDDAQTLKSFFIDTYSDGKLAKRDALPMDAFIKDGIKVNNKYNFAKISSQNFDQEQGGMIIIEALYNILTGKRKSYEMQLAKDKIGWKLFSNGHAINQIIAHANRVPVIGIVGAKDLVMK